MNRVRAPRSGHHGRHRPTPRHASHPSGARRRRRRRDPGGHPAGDPRGDGRPRPAHVGDRRRRRLAVCRRRPGTGDTPAGRAARAAGRRYGAACHRDPGQPRAAGGGADARTVRGARPGRARVAPEGRVPGGDEPRDPDADEQHRRHGGTDGRHAARRANSASTATPSAPPPTRCSASSTTSSTSRRSRRRASRSSTLDFDLRLVVEDSVELLAAKAASAGIDSPRSSSRASRPLPRRPVPAAAGRRSTCSATPSSSRRRGRWWCGSRRWSTAPSRRASASRSPTPASASPRRAWRGCSGLRPGRGLHDARVRRHRARAHDLEADRRADGRSHRRGERAGRGSTFWFEIALPRALPSPAGAATRGPIAGGSCWSLRGQRRSAGTGPRRAGHRGQLRDHRRRCARPPSTPVRAASRWRFVSVAAIDVAPLVDVLAQHPAAAHTAVAAIVPAGRRAGADLDRLGSPHRLTRPVRRSRLIECLDAMTAGRPHAPASVPAPTAVDAPPIADGPRARPRRRRLLRQSAAGHAAAREARLPCRRGRRRPGRRRAAPARRSISS